MRRVLKQILLFILVTAILFTNIQISQAAGTGTVRVNDFYQMKSQEESTIIKEEKSQEEGDQEKDSSDYKDKEDKIIGFDVDITNAGAKEMGAKTEYKSMPFDQIVQAVADNKADIAVAAGDMTQDRADKVNFSSIYYNKESVSILSRKDDERIHGSQDLSGKTVAVEKGTVYVMTAKQLGATVKEYDYHDQLIQAVESKEADALILDKPVALFYMTHGAADKLRSAGIISGSGGFVMLLNKKDPALQKEVNEALGKLMNNGEYDKIYDKWFADTNFEKEPDVKR